MQDVEEKVLADYVVFHNFGLWCSSSFWLMVYGGCLELQQKGKRGPQEVITLVVRSKNYEYVWPLNLHRWWDKVWDGVCSYYFPYRP